MGRMLRYDDEQPIKPETWAQQEQGVERLGGRAQALRLQPMIRTAGPFTAAGAPHLHHHMLRALTPARVPHHGNAVPR